MLERTSPLIRPSCSRFYYEVFTNLRESRRWVLAGFPQFRSVYTPTLYQFEKDVKRPAESISARRVTVNPDVISGKRGLTSAEQQCVEDFAMHAVHGLAAGLVAEIMVSEWR
jgi:hypothetical protein